MHRIMWHPQQQYPINSLVKFSISIPRKGVKTYSLFVKSSWVPLNQIRPLCISICVTAATYCPLQFWYPWSVICQQAYIILVVNTFEMSFFFSGLVLLDFWYKVSKPAGQRVFPCIIHLTLAMELSISGLLRKTPTLRNMYICMQMISFTTNL